MPVSGIYNPDLISRYDEGLIRFINENFLAIKRVFENVALETISTIPPSSPYDGQTYIDTTNDVEYTYDGATSNWLAINRWGAWSTTFTPTIQQGGAIAKTTVRSSFEKKGRSVKFNGHVNLTAAGVGGNNILVSVPAAMVAPSNLVIGEGFIYDASHGVNIPLLAIAISSANIGFIYAEARTGGIVGAAADPVFSPSAFQLASGDAILWNVNYESTS